MEYEKPPTAPVFSRKLRNRSHSLSFSANVAYDGVFASPATKKPPPAIDYGEIFRGSGPSSSSSIPFLDVPELYEEKVKVDIRSFKLDYSSVFGGFEGCDFTVSPEELITKPERKRPAEDKRKPKKSGNSSDFPPSTKAKHHISSPEVEFNASYHQSAPRDEKGINGKTQVAPVQVQAISGYSQLVDNPCPLPKVESRTPISSVEKESCNKASVKVTYCNNTQVDIPSTHGLRKQNSHSEAEFEIISGRNGSNMSDSFTGNICKTDPNVKQPDLTPPSSLQHSIHGDKEASERSLGLKSGVSRSFPCEDVHSPCSPPYFDEETDANSAAAASSAALKRAIEEAQLRINIAKQMMEKKKVGFRGPAKPRSSDSLKAKDKGNRKLERQTEKYRDSETKSVGEVVNSSKQTFSLEGGRVLGELVNYSEQSLPNLGKRNAGEVGNSFVQSFPNMGEHIVEVVNSSNQSSPNARKRNAGAVNSSEQLFPDKEDQNIGEAVNSSQQPILNGEEQNVCEVVNPYEQSILSGKELNVSKAVNSSEHSFPQKGEQNVGEAVNSSEQLLPHKGEPNIGEAVNSSEQLIPNGGEQNVCELMNSSEQSIPNAGEGNVSEAVNSSEQLFPNVGEKTVGEVASSSKQSSINVGKRNAGEVVNSSEQLSPDVREQNIGEMVISSEQLIPNKGEQNVGEALNSSEQSIPEAEEQNVGEVVISSEQSFPSKEEKNVSEVVDSSEQSFSNKGERNLGAIPDEEECNVGEVEISSKQSSLDQGEQQVKRARRLWEVPGGLLKSTLHHMQVEAIEREVIEEEEEHARKARKYWELPGGIFKSNEELQGVTQNSFYSFGQLGNKLKCVVEAFTGNKGPQTSEAEGTEHVTINSHEKSNITPEVRDQEEERMFFYGEEILVDSSDTEICQSEVEEILKPIDGQSSSQSDENAESTMCEELKWNKHSENASEAYNAPLAGVNETHENFNLIHEILDQDFEKVSLSEPQEMLVGPVDTKTYEREVEEIQQGPNQSMRKSQIHENVGPMESILAENASVSGHVPEGNEKEHKIPRRRRAWKASEDVYDMIKGLKRYNRAWHLDDEEKEMMKRCLREQSASVDDAIDDEETEIISELPTDSGLQENWNVLKQMFRQMFQTVDTKRDDGACCLVESDQNQIDIHKSAEGMDGNGTAAAGTSNYEAYGRNSRENVDLELALKAYCNKEESEVEEQNRSSFVYELIGEELDAIELANNREMEDVSEVSEADEVDQGAYGLKDMKKQAESHADVLEHDQSETCSSNSDEKLDQKPCKEQAEETKICSEIDDDLRGPLFESGHGDSDIEEFSLEHKLYDGCSENAGSTSSMEECVEEVDSESNKNGLYVGDMEFIGDLNENSNSVASQSPCLPEVAGNTKPSFEDNEGMANHEYPEDFGSKSNMEAAAPFSCSSKEDEEVAAADRNMEESNREYSSRLSVNEERGATTTDASQNKAEPAEKHTKKMNETKEKEKEREKERIMVERAIREARERAFVEVRERVERAAMEKANTRAHRRTTSEVRGRSEKASVEANDKLSSSEKASMQAKLRAERAAVERALNEARERALEKALSGKAASQTRSQVGKSSGERRGSSSGAENRSSAPSSSNPSGHGEPAQRCKSRSERHQRTAERAAKALAEKKLRDLIAQKEQAERNRLAETLDAEVKRWSNGKEGNLRALLSTLQYILGPESGWKPIHLTDLVSSAAVRKAYRKATLYVHPDKLQQRGAATQQKYICEKVFDLLKEAWNRFSAEER